MFLSYYYNLTLPNFINYIQYTINYILFFYFIILLFSILSFPFSPPIPIFHINKLKAFSHIAQSYLYER